MGDVVDIERAKPHLSGPAICTECEREWHAVIVNDRYAELLECPSCRKFFGVLRGPQVPDVMFRCNCGSNLFYLTPQGHQCRSCGALSLDWCNT